MNWYRVLWVCACREHAAVGQGMTMQAAREVAMHNWLRAHGPEVVPADETIANVSALPTLVAMWN